jgi:TPR repeat protein/LysM repeat protein
VRNPAALTRFPVPTKIGRAVISAALFGSLGLASIRSQSVQALDLTQVRDKAERSDPDAQNTLGNAYSSGSGVKQDYVAALSWYRKAAEQGFSPAQFNLGLAYELGRGVQVDERQAFKYYLMSAEQGFGPAQFNIGNMYSTGRGVGQDLFEASLWYKQAAEKGITEAQFNLGLAYETGRGVKKDELQASKWYQPAADRGFARAQYNLGLLFEEGRGVSKDERAAAALYRAAAEQGFASAQNNYGLMISEGRGDLAKDAVQALMWLSLAVQNGANPAARDFVSQGLTPAQLAEAAHLVDERRKPASAVVASTLATASAVGGPLPAAAAVETVNNLNVTAAQSPAEKPTTEIAPSAPVRRSETLAKDPQGEKTEPEKNIPSLAKTPGENEAQQKLTRVQQQLEETNQALEKSGASVAELTTENDRLEKELKAAKQAASSAPGAVPDMLPVIRRDTTDLATLREERASLREENNRLRQAGAEASAMRLQNEQMTASLNGSRRDLDQAQARVADLQKQLDAVKIAQLPVAGVAVKQPPSSTDDNASIDKLTATVAELTAANDKLEKDLDNARKSTDAALAAQSQAVSAAQPDAYKMEISTLQAHVKELEGQVEEERNSTAKEISTMASQLQRTRDTNRSLTEANRALLAGKENEGASNEEVEQLRGKVRELTATGEELRRQNQRAGSDTQKIAADRDALKLQLEDTRKAAVMVSSLADERTALQEKLESVGTQLVKAQQELDVQHKTTDDLTTQLAQSRQIAEKATGDLAAQQARATEAEKASESHNTSVAELTQANTRLDQEKEDMRRLVDSYRLDIARLTQNVRSAEQQRAESERSGQQNIDAVTSQLVQMRREVESGRMAQSRMAEAATAHDRDRASVIAQLRQENSALVARLTQAQGTLDQIAAAARLGTPAAAIASGSPAPVRPASNAGSVETALRYHTVSEGDSLSRISMRYYGTPNRWQDIFQANREVLQGNNSLRVGMQLRIP